MFYLLKEDKSLMFYLVKKKTYTIGRNNADFTITKDSSVSKRHAEIMVNNEGVFITDLGSKYKTRLNDFKIEVNIPFKLKVGDSIKFGLIDSTFVLGEMNLKVTCSGLNVDGKKEFIKYMSIMGGKILANWSDECTHVTTEEIVLTTKILCALTQGVPIVTLKYWKKFSECIEKYGNFPKEEHFTPPICEALLNQNVSIEYNPDRKFLFFDKIFVFPSAAVEQKMMDIVKLAGGTTKSFDTMSSKHFKNLDNFIIMQATAEKPVSTSKQHLYDTVVNELSARNQRTIPISEIALAVIRCSCEKDCNPNFDRKSNLITCKIEVKNELELVLETQSQLECNFTEKVIPETEIDHVMSKSDVVLPNVEKIKNILKCRDKEELESPDIKRRKTLEEPATSNDVESSQSTLYIDEHKKTNECKRKFNEDSSDSLKSLDSVYERMSEEENLFETLKYYGGKKPKKDEDSTSSSTVYKKGSVSRPEKIFTILRPDLYRPDNRINENISDEADTLIKREKEEDSESFIADKQSVELFGILTDLLEQNKVQTKKNRKSLDVDDPLEGPSKKYAKTSEVAGTSENETFGTTSAKTIRKRSKKKKIKADISNIKVNLPFKDADGWISKPIEVKTEDESEFSNGENENPECSDIETIDDSSSGEDENREVKEYIDSLRNSIIVYETDVLVRDFSKTTINDTKSSIGNTTNSILRNYKKFEKVKPLHEQTLIIPKKDFVKFVCKGSAVTESDSESDNENLRAQKGKTKEAYGI